MPNHWDIPHLADNSPIATGSNPLTNILSAKVRAVAYAVLFVAALVFGLFQAADGDWWVFAGSLITSLLGLVAASNASTTPVKPDANPEV